MIYDETTQEQDAARQTPGYTDPYTSYGALINRFAVSTGYAMAYQQLCEEAGILFRVIPGRLGGENHSWNLVMLSD